MSSEFGQFLDDLPDLNLPESKKPKRSAAYFINLRGVSKDIYKYLVQLDAWLDTPEKLSQWRAIVDAVLQRVQRYEKGKHKQPAKHPWPFAREPQELNLRIDEDLKALCVIVSLWHDHYTSGYPVLTAQQKETIRKWPYRPCSYGAAVLLQWFAHLYRYVKAKGLVSDLAKVALEQPIEASGKREIKTEPAKQNLGETTDRGKVPEEVWSQPLSKTEIATILNLLSVYKLNQAVEADVYQIRPAGNGSNRQLWEIRLDTLDREKHEKFNKFKLDRPTILNK